jgi:hypothetical protein
VIPTDEQTPPEYIERAAQELESKRVHYMLWSRRAEAADTKLVHLGAIREYLNRKYRCVHVFPDGDQVFERN